MSSLRKLTFRSGEDGGVLIEFHGDGAFVSYFFEDPDETFNTLQVMAQCLAGDMEGKGIEWDPDYTIECLDTCDNMMEKFSEPQLRAIMQVLYEHDLPSDLDVLAQEIQMRMR